MRLGGFELDILFWYGPLEFIWADLAMKSSVSDSVRLGRIVQDSLKNLGLKQAMFYVLMGAKMPAILVETSFISNKTDEKRLRKSGLAVD